MASDDHDFLRVDKIDPPPPVPPTPPPPPGSNGDHGRERAYALAALRGECEKLASTAVGRNDTLNAVAFGRLSGFVNAGSLSEAEVVDGLLGAGRRASALGDHPFTDTEIRRTLQSALGSGAVKGTLRQAPPRADTNGQAHSSEGKTDTDDAGRRLRWQRGTDIKTAVPVWAWHYRGKGRIQLGTLSLLAGRPGAGKSSAARWFAAQASIGELDGYWEGEPQQIAYIAAEESLKYTIVPGLRASGADMSHIHFPGAFHDGQPTQLLSTLDEAMLTDYMLVHKITIVIVDPLMSTVTGSTDINRNNEVRGQIVPWSRVADTIGGIVLGVVHLRKNSSTGDVVAAINGSSAFGEVARSIFGFARIPDTEERVMSQHKNSTGTEDLAVTYEISSRVLQADDGDTADVGVFEVTGDSEITVEDILCEGTQLVGTGAECQRWLADYLSVEGPARAKDVQKEAQKVGGWAYTTVHRAAKKLKVIITSEGFPRMTFWAIPTIEHKF